jgi:hypothetical protein
LRGDDAVESMIAHLGEHPDYNDELHGVLSNYQEHLRDEIDQEYQNRLDQERERYADQAGDDYDPRADREDYLTQFHADNPQRFAFGKAEQNTWHRNPDGGATYKFTTSAGNAYDIDVYNYGSIGGMRVPSIQFSDEEGKFAVTGAGNPFEVFGSVVPAIVSYVHHNDLPAATFSAAEPSRQRLYDRLVKTVAKVMPDYFAAYYDPPPRPDGGVGPRTYVIGKREIRPQLQQAFTERVPKGSRGHVLVASRYGSQPTGGLRELRPQINPTWFAGFGPSPLTGRMGRTPPTPQTPSVPDRRTRRTSRFVPSTTSLPTSRIRLLLPSGRTAGGVRRFWP